MSSASRRRRYRGAPHRRRGLEVELETIDQLGQAPCLRLQRFGRGR
jgi:hypothetical protein